MSSIFFMCLPDKVRKPLLQQIDINIFTSQTPMPMLNKSKAACILFVRTDAVSVLVTAVNTHALSLTRQYADTATLDFCNHKNNLCSMAAWAFAAPSSEMHQTADAAQSGLKITL